jgi:hypothetical protein
MPLYRGSRRILFRSVSPTPGPAAAAFLTRTSGLSTRERNAYITLINGLVADGIFSLLDLLYILATNNTTTAALNLVSSSFSLVTNGSLTFTPDVGYTGDGSTGYLNTQLAPSAATQFTQNSGSIGAYIQTNQTTADASVIMGSALIGSYAYMSPMNTGSVFTFNVNDNVFTGPANTTSKGAWTASRTSSSQIDLYKNGSTTPFGTNAAATSVAPSTVPWALFALNTNGVISNFSAYQASAFFAGGGLTSAQAVSVNNRINAYMAALGANVY